MTAITTSKRERQMRLPYLQRRENWVWGRIQAEIDKSVMPQVSSQVYAGVEGIHSQRIRTLVWFNVKAMTGGPHGRYSGTTA